MSITNTKTLLKHADKHNYAVAAIDVTNLTFAHAIIQAAERSRSPLIVSIAEMHFPVMHLEATAKGILEIIDKATVPVALSLDHGVTIEGVVRAMDAGFTSVMFDGSHLDIDENVALTQKVVSIAKGRGVSVEGEVGRIGGVEGGGDDQNKHTLLALSDPDECLMYTEATGVDLLAVAVGNAHGEYNGTPKLDFQRIKIIQEKCGIPLVLHGGSGISNDAFTKGVEMGIRKVNIYTDISVQSMKVALKELQTRNYTDFAVLQQAMFNCVEGMAEQYFHRFGSIGKV